MEVIYLCSRHHFCLLFLPSFVVFHDFYEILGERSWSLNALKSQCHRKRVVGPVLSSRAVVRAPCCPVHM